MTPRRGLKLQEGRRLFYKDAASTRLHSRQGAQACISGNSPQICRTPVKTYWLDPYCLKMVKSTIDGRVAQLGERGVRNAEVEGSIPFSSTRLIPQRFFQFQFSGYRGFAGVVLADVDCWLAMHEAFAFQQGQLGTWALVFGIK